MAFTRTLKAGWLVSVALLGLAITAPAYSLVAPQEAAKQKPQAAPAEKVFNAESFTLKNGMQVVLIPNHRAPVATHMVWYKVGSADEDSGVSGVAHFVEHLMFKGSRNVPPGEFSKRVRSLGGDDNAFTSYDYTAYHQTVPVDHLEDVMKMEADRMQGLLFLPDQVKSERDVVIEERRGRTEDDPRGFFTEQLRNALFVNHPYAHPVLGWLQEMGALEHDNVKHFYEKWYAPNNAILVVSGDITMDRLRPLAEKYYGHIPAKKVPERKWTEVPTLLANQTMTLQHPAVRQSEFYRLYRVPSMIENKQDSLALEVLQDIMDGSAATRLYKSLVVEQKIATSAGMDYGSGSRSDSTLWLSAAPVPGVTPEQIGKAFDAELTKLIEKGVTEQELAEAKARLKDEAVFERDSLTGPAMLIGAVLTVGGTLDDVEYWPQHIDSVTAAQIQDVAKRYLDPKDNHKRPHVDGFLLLTPGAKGGPAAALPPAGAGGPVR